MANFSSFEYVPDTTYYSQVRKLEKYFNELVSSPKFGIYVAKPLQCSLRLTVSAVVLAEEGL